MIIPLDAFCALLQWVPVILEITFSNLVLANDGLLFALMGNEEKKRSFSENFQYLFSYQEFRMDVPFHSGDIVLTDRHRLAISKLSFQKVKVHIFGFNMSMILFINQRVYLPFLVNHFRFSKD
jgi:hypothetical protein